MCGDYYLGTVRPRSQEVAHNSFCNDPVIALTGQHEGRSAHRVQIVDVGATGDGLTHFVRAMSHTRLQKVQKQLLLRLVVLCLALSRRTTTVTPAIHPTPATDSGEKLAGLNVISGGGWAAGCRMMLRLRESKVLKRDRATLEEEEFAFRCVLRANEEHQLLELVAPEPEGEEAEFLWSALAERAPLELWHKVLRCVPFANAAAVDCFWLHTWPLWYSPDSEELCHALQECALFVEHPWLLCKLRASGLYDARRNKPDMLHDVGNVKACRLLLAEGFRVNNTCARGLPPLFDVRTRAVASCLLDAGADMSLVLLNDALLPPLRVLDWLLELRPPTLFVDVWPVALCDIFTSGRHRQDSMLDIVGVLAKRRCELPRAAIAGVTDPETLAALFTHGYLAELPGSVTGSVSRNMLYWRSHTHRYFGNTGLTGRVRTALLVMRRLCPMLPRDVRCWVLARAFSEW